MEIKAAMMHIMADSGYNDESTQARINNFVTRKRNEITSTKKIIKKENKRGDYFRNFFIMYF